MDYNNIHYCSTSLTKNIENIYIFLLGSELYLNFPLLLVCKEKMFSEYPILPNQQVCRISSIMMILDFFLLSLQPLFPSPSFIHKFHLDVWKY